MRIIRCAVSALLCGLVLSSIPADAAPKKKAVRGAPKLPPVILEGSRAEDVAAQASMLVVSAPAAAPYATGAGVKVAVLDGGFDLRHEYLAGHIGAQYDALDQDAYAQDLGDGIDEDNDGIADDFVGHGTFTSGIIIACAPDATILPIRVLDDEGRGNEAALARGIDAAVSMGADVISMSLVSPTASTQLQNAIDDAVSAGVVIVIAAGDDPAGPFNASYLANRAIAVGAIEDTRTVAAFSPTDSQVDLYAPGVDVLGPLGGAVQNSYAAWTGTSFSCPFVSAAAALVRENHPTMNVTAMRARLVATADLVSGSTKGSVDLAAALTAQ